MTTDADRVKPLEWEGSEARTPQGDLYSVRQLSRIVWVTSLNGTDCPGWSPTEALAKARAQAHYDNSAALAPAPQAADAKPVTRGDILREAAQIVRDRADFSLSAGAAAFNHQPAWHEYAHSCANTLEQVAALAGSAAPLSASPVLTEPTTQALSDVAAERRRQIEVEGWTPEHDDRHARGEMATAAACYAIGADGRPALTERSEFIQRYWPWAFVWWRPTNRRRDLVKAGALILAEIERLDRKEGNGNV